MYKYLTGFAVGLALGFTAPVAAATIVGGMGYMFGWTVTKDGDEICDAPFVWPVLREIECD